MIDRGSFAFVLVTALLMAATGALPGTAVAGGNKTTYGTVYAKGKPAKGRRVVLEFVGGLLFGGMTDSFRTNSSGTATVRHASSGKVQVYVDGNWSSHRFADRAPGSIDVYLSR